MHAAFAQNQGSTGRRPLAGRRAVSGNVQPPQLQQQQPKGHGRRSRRSPAERDAAALALENRDPLELVEDWGVDDAESGYQFAEKGNRLTPSGGGQWALLSPEPSPQKPRAEDAASLKSVVPRRDEMLRRRRARLGGGDTDMAVARSEQPVMRANHTLSALRREQRQFQKLTSSLNGMKAGGRSSGADLAEAWHRAQKPEKSVAQGGLGSRGTSASSRRSDMMTMGPTDAASWRRAGGGGPQQRKSQQLRPLSQPSDRDDAASRAAQRKARVQSRSRSAPMLPEDSCTGGEVGQRVRDLQAL